MQVVDTSDVRSNPNEQIAHAAKVIGRSADRKKVFEFIHTGKRKIKTVEEISDGTGLPRKRVLEEGKKLVNNHILEQVKRGTDSDTAYEKNNFFAQNKKRIISLSTNPKKLKSFPTKYNPQQKDSIIINFNTKEKPRISFISVDDVDSFAKVNRVTPVGSNNRLPEIKLKEGFKKILGEEGDFKDWGGENDDLSTTRLEISGKRKPTAIAFKGPATTGKLVPKKMGKNGDQILRLFTCPAVVFLVVYQGQIDDSILKHMEINALARSFSMGKKIFYGIIDEKDVNRLLAAFPEAFT